MLQQPRSAYLWKPVDEKWKTRTVLDAKQTHFSLSEASSTACVTSDLLNVPNPAQATLHPSPSAPLYTQYHQWKAKDDPCCINLSIKRGTSHARSSYTDRPRSESLTSRPRTRWLYPCPKAPNHAATRSANSMTYGQRSKGERKQRKTQAAPGTEKHLDSGHLA